MYNDSEISRNELLEWISTAVSTNAHSLGQGYQGCTYLYEKDGRRLVVKAPTGRGTARWIRRRLLHHEYRVYSMLKDADGIPECYGFLDGSYLILEYVDGPSIRKAEISDPKRFFNALLACIQDLHTRGVAHGDLKKKDNILVIDNRYPFLVDFGVAIIRNAGWAPVNHYLYSLFQRFDNNAWIKHKYNRKTDRICEEDLRYYNRTWIESIAGVLKHCYLKIKKTNVFSRPFHEANAEDVRFGLPPGTEPTAWNKKMIKNICVKKGRRTLESSGTKSRTDEIEISYTGTQISPPFEHIDIRPGIKMIMAEGPLPQGLKMGFDIEHAPVSFTYSLAQRVRCTIKTGAGKGHTVIRSPGDATVAYLPATRGSVEVSPSQAGWGLSLHFTIDTFNTLFQEAPRGLGKISAGSSAGKRFFHQSRFGGETLMAIKQLLECPYSGEIKRLYMEAKAMELVALKLSELNAPAFHRSGLFSRRDLDRAREAHHILLASLADPPDLIELSRRVGINRNKLNRCFRQLYGNTVFGVLRDARLAKASSLLTRTELSLSEISFKVGYNNQANFTTAFRKKFGLTPGAARLEPLKNTVCIRQ